MPYGFREMRLMQGWLSAKAISCQLICSRMYSSCGRPGSAPGPARFLPPCPPAEPAEGAGRGPLSAHLLARGAHFLAGCREHSLGPCPSTWDSSAEGEKDPPRGSSLGPSPHHRPSRTQACSRVGPQLAMPSPVRSTDNLRSALRAPAHPVCHPGRHRGGPLAVMGWEGMDTPRTCSSWKMILLRRYCRFSFA